MSIKAWNDEQEAELIMLYKDDGVKDVHKLAYQFSKGYRVDGHVNCISVKKQMAIIVVKIEAF